MTVDNIKVVRGGGCVDFNLFFTMNWHFQRMIDSLLALNGPFKEKNCYSEKHRANFTRLLKDEHEQIKLMWEYICETVSQPISIEMSPKSWTRYRQLCATCKDPNTQSGIRKHFLWCCFYSMNSLILCLFH